MLEIRGISKSFNNQPILHNVSLTAQPGEVTVLLGASGSGKSTILRILNDLERAETGDIILNGDHIDPTKPHQTRRIGMVFQSFHVFSHMSVLDNITLTLEKARNMPQEQAEQRAHQLLAEYHLSEQADICAKNLSGGQQQRLAIARTVATQPDVVCLDEPTSALDPNLTEHVAQIIMQLAHDGYIVILATHDIHLVQQISGTIHLLQNGRIVETASAQQAFSEPSESSHIADFLGIEISR